MSAQGLCLVADAFFDGERFHERTSLLIENGVIADIRAGDVGEEAAARGLETAHAPFLMPGLVDAHVHLFLDGAPTDLAERSAHMKKTEAQLLDFARRSARQSVAYGVSMVRDAGDRYGVNNAVRDEAKRPDSGFAQVRSGGLGLRRPKRYGAFMATEVTDANSIREKTVAAARSSDEVKLILTGIIDFEKGAVPDEPQFDLDEVRLIVATAKTEGRSVFAHCSGAKGLKIAAAAGIGSIEHGFFMTDDVLKVMRDNDVAWTPTFCPVHAQWANPEPMKWNADTVGHLRRILDSHAEHLTHANAMGVTLLLGTDAGSMGVEHGKAMLTEMRCYLGAGLPLEAVLRAATSTARARFGVADRILAKNAAFDAFAYAGDPRQDLDTIARPQRGWLTGREAALR